MILGCCSCRENRTPALHVIALCYLTIIPWNKPIDSKKVTCTYFQLYHTRIQVCFQTVQDRQINILADLVPDILLTIRCNAILTNLIPMTQCHIRLHINHNILLHYRHTMALRDSLVLYIIVCFISKTLNTSHSNTIWQRYSVSTNSKLKNMSKK